MMLEVFGRVRNRAHPWVEATWRYQNYVTGEQFSCSLQSALVPAGRVSASRFEMTRLGRAIQTRAGCASDCPRRRWSPM